MQFKNMQKEEHLTFISTTFHILPAMYAKECCIMFVHGASKTNLIPLSLVFDMSWEEHEWSF